MLRPYAESRPTDLKEVLVRCVAFIIIITTMVVRNQKSLRSEVLQCLQKVGELIHTMAFPSPCAGEI